ncbi:glycosyltransferase involved in cell wall biosynthesis [Mucilaginibacter yixingensis]|uniref:Glycosyltransferase involved in cell wall biosynthesis n=2 Tax=Mucilaginibacter yixingensis TaxID=1295612 RepID=A0A2T5JGU4_9SPHI|nr:glycosyltransferase involved in cell wall biosynthesis [Mucilaginibacter yixingensis]
MSCITSNSRLVFFTYHDFESHHVTGGTRRLLELIRSFSDKGAHVTIFCPKSKVIEEIPNVNHIPLKYKKNGFLPAGLVNFIINYFFVKKQLKQLDYDWSVAVDVPYAIQLKYLGFRKICFIVWQDFIGYRSFEGDSLKNGFINNLRLKTLTRIEKIVLQSVSKINIQCQYDLDVLKGRHPMLSSQIIKKAFLIPNNVNTSWLQKETQTESSMTKDAHCSGFTIMFIGNVSDTRKGLHILLEAYAGTELLNTCKLHIIGGGDLLPYYKKKYSKFKNITFEGSNPSPLSFLKAANLLVVPSLADSFPNTILEALYLNIPVIGSNKGGIPEALKYEELIFELNAEALQKKIVSLLDKKNYLEIAEICKKRKEELTFDWGKDMLNGIIC